MGNCIQRQNTNIIKVEAVDVSLDCLPKTPFEDIYDKYYWISLYTYSTKNIILYQKDGYSIISKNDDKLPDSIWLRKRK